MWPFKREIKRCGRHKLLEKLDKATAIEKGAQDKLNAMSDSRRKLVIQLVGLAEDRYFKRYVIKEEESFEELINRDSNEPKSVEHWMRCASNISPNVFFNWGKEAPKVFGATTGLINYLEREDFKDCPETYELVLLLLGIIRECDNAIICQKRIHGAAISERSKVVKEIKRSAIQPR